MGVKMLMEANFDWNRHLLVSNIEIFFYALALLGLSFPCFNPLQLNTEIATLFRPFPWTFSTPVAVAHGSGCHERFLGVLLSIRSRKSQISFFQMIPEIATCHPFSAFLCRWNSHECIHLESLSIWSGKIQTSIYFDWILNCYFPPFRKHIWKIFPSPAPITISCHLHVRTSNNLIFCFGCIFKSSVNTAMSTFAWSADKELKAIYFDAIWHKIESLPETNSNLFLRLVPLPWKHSFGFAVNRKRE